MIDWQNAIVLLLVCAAAAYLMRLGARRLNSRAGTSCGSCGNCSGSSPSVQIVEIRPNVLSITGTQDSAKS